MNQLASDPIPDTGTPTAWQVSLSNNTGLELAVKIFIECVTPTGSSSSSATPRAHHPIIVKQTVTKFVHPRTARH